MALSYRRRSEEGEQAEPQSLLGDQKRKTAIAFVLENEVILTRDGHAMSAFEGVS